VNPLKIFATGGSGLLGAELVKLSLQAGHDVYSGFHEHPPLAGKPVQLDLTELEQIDTIVEQSQPDIIIHTAALSDVDLCEEKPDLANIVNGEATGRIGEAAAKRGIYVVHVSTDYVFDGIAGSYREDDRPNPVNNYGKSKLLGEELLRRSGANYSIGRSSVIYGWGRRSRPNFATWVLDKLLSNHTVKVVKDQVVSPTLNSNLAEMILDLAEKRIEGMFHLAGSSSIDRYTFALQIAGIFRLDSSLVKPVLARSLEWKAKRPANSSLNVEKATNLLDKKPLGLRESLEQFRAAKNQ
jgi:dTDP-4-dehydrorhamnose reductase